MNKRKLARETIENKSCYISATSGIYCYSKDAIIDAMLSFHEQASKDMYPEDFVKYSANCYYENGIYWHDGNTYTLDELYKIWQTNVKDR
jgi:hypothetical protein